MGNYETQVGFEEIVDILREEFNSTLDSDNATVQDLINTLIDIGSDSYDYHDDYLGLEGRLSDSLLKTKLVELLQYNEDELYDSPYGDQIGMIVEEANAIFICQNMI